MAQPQRFTSPQQNPDDIFGGSVLPSIGMTGGTNNPDPNQDTSASDQAMQQAMMTGTGADTGAGAGAGTAPPPVAPAATPPPVVPPPVTPAAQTPAAATPPPAATPAPSEPSTYVTPTWSTGIPWAPGVQNPMWDPVGYHWDPTYASEQPDDPTHPSNANVKFSDPATATALVNYYANDPNANPSLKSDPSYWTGKLESGALGNDLGYIQQVFERPEGAPAGGGSDTNPAAAPGSVPTDPSGNPVNFGNGAGVDLFNEIGQDPFSQTIEGGLSNLINNEGMTSQQQSVFETLKDIIGRSGRDPSLDPIVQQQLEHARENEASANTSMLNDAQAELANRGLIGQPGQPQGEEGGAISRIAQTIAPQYATAVRDVNTAAIQAQNDRLTSALTNITGLTGSAASNLLNALGQGTQRQIGLANIALQELSLNEDWNKFLANYGLTRDQVLYQIQQGNSNALLPLLTLFEQATAAGAAGHV
jgi:hypothetical protein